MDEDIWAGLSSFQAISFTQRFLKTCYGRLDLKQSEAVSYQNSYPFLYYLQHGKRHYQLADSAPVELQPLLLFYGMTQLMKACLLTVDPEYPKTTAVLAHGVSTRKKKKKNYAFSDDEVRIQKHGLATYFAEKLYHCGRLEGRKFTMDSLLERIPDLNDLFREMYGRPPFYRIGIGENGEMEMPAALLDDLHMTQARFIEFFEKHFHTLVKDSRETQTTLLVRLENIRHPLPSTLDGDLYISRNRERYDDLPEMLVHFLLLYNLSMIARYETEWWSELFHQAADDLPFIQLFLNITAKKIPRLTAGYLHSLRK
ncbi:MAG TPA: YaaC family protein [Bacillales bacterium]|nr:YaaC family protein [Bacillales bacterium]